MRGVRFPQTKTERQILYSYLLTRFHITYGKGIIICMMLSHIFRLHAGAV